jgi:hypothetical protein
MMTMAVDAELFGHSDGILLTMASRGFGCIIARDLRSLVAQPAPRPRRACSIHPIVTHCSVRSFTDRYCITDRSRRPLVRRHAAGSATARSSSAWCVSPHRPCCTLIQPGTIVPHRSRMAWFDARSRPRPHLRARTLSPAKFSTPRWPAFVRRPHGSISARIVASLRTARLSLSRPTRAKKWAHCPVEGRCESPASAGLHAPTHRARELHRRSGTSGTSVPVPLELATQALPRPFKRPPPPVAQPHFTLVGGARRRVGMW